jgi:hypothetical protein
MRIFGYIVLAVVVVVVCSALLQFCSYAGKVVDTTMNAIDPSALLQKYEWFKGASAQLQKKRADITIYEERMKPYKEMDPLKMPRHVSEQMLVWSQELAGIRASYNSLAADYNSQMSKINWAFTNVGSLPRGAKEPLPREFAPYTTN